MCVVKLSTSVTKSAPPPHPPSSRFHSNTSQPCPSATSDSLAVMNEEFNSLSTRGVVGTIDGGGGATCTSKSEPGADKPAGHKYTCDDGGGHVMKCCSSLYIQLAGHSQLPYCLLFKKTSLLLPAGYFPPLLLLSPRESVQLRSPALRLGSVFGNCDTAVASYAPRRDHKFNREGRRFSSALRYARHHFAAV